MDESSETGQHTASAQETNTALVKESIDQSIAFSENSGQIYRDIITQVQHLNPDSIYPPSDFPSSLENHRGSGISEQAGSGVEVGRVSPVEGVAAQFLLEESLAIAQGEHTGTSFPSTNIADRIKERFGLPEAGHTNLALEGVVEFGISLRSAAGVRERLLRSEGPPEVKTKKDKIIANAWNTYADPIQKDGMKIGEYTTQAIIDTIKEQAERTLQDDPAPKGRRTQLEMDAARRETRLESKRIGAVRARSLYLELIKKAEREGLSSQVKIKSV